MAKPDLCSRCTGQASDESRAKKLRKDLDRGLPVAASPSSAESPTKLRSQDDLFKDWFDRYVKNDTVSTEEMMRSIESEAREISLELTPFWVPTALVPILVQPVCGAWVYLARASLGLALTATDPPGPTDPCTGGRGTAGGRVHTTKTDL